MSRRGAGPVRILIVTVDPERDTPVAPKDYLAYLPRAYTGLTGSATAVYLVDPAGWLRAHYPFGTEAPAILADLARLASD